jgi:asparaginyl-tRNA synthetase
LPGASPPELYPLAKGRLPLDFLRGHPHLRGRTNTHGAVARVRSALAYAVHQFFQQQQFHYVHTPIITTSDCEGAGELFSVTTLLSGPHRLIPQAQSGEEATAERIQRGDGPRDVDACEAGGADGALSTSETAGKVDYGSDFFRKAAFLTVSGQLHAEASALALGKVRENS